MDSQKFVILTGAQKAGTSYLASILRKVPNLVELVDKDSPADLVESEIRKFKGMRGQRRYPLQAGKRGLVASVDIFENPESIRAAVDADNATVIVSIRDPYERAASALWWYWRRGEISRDQRYSAEMGLLMGAPGPESALLEDLVGRSLYARKLEALDSLFGHRRVYWVLFDELAEPSRLTERLSNALNGIPLPSICAESKPKQASRFVTLSAIEALVNRLGADPRIASRIQSNLAKYFGGLTPSKHVFRGGRPVRADFEDDLRRVATMADARGQDCGSRKIIEDWRSGGGGCA